MTWQLSAILAGHKGDVKAVIAPTDDLIASVSRDKSLITWKRQSSNTFSKEKTFEGHTNYVNSVAFIGASATNPHGLIVTGGSDRLINVWDPEDSNSPVYTLAGHTDNVCSLFADSDGHIVSGSWDKTAKIWRNWECVYTLEGHTQAIWGVLELEHEVIVTASADKTIAMWKDGKKIKTITGHEDCVRSLALLPGIGFVSCGNDGAVIVWSNNGDPVQALDGHTSFVYSLATLPTGEIFSSGEDRTVRVWENGRCTQTIIHPCVSVWCVAALPNGDIVSGGSDGFVRVFTRTAERIADADTLKAYDEENATAAIPSNQVGDIKKDDLPGPEALGQPGRKDQEVKMVRVGNTVEAHMWSNADQEWSKVGEVVDAVGQNRKQLYGGVEYDHVFDIDVGEGVPALKLPFNVTENPYTAAQEFLTRHDLPQVYLDQVADFITKNARAVSQGAAAATGDPLTGGSRYTPGQTSSSGLGSYNPWGNEAPKAQPAAKRLIPQLLNVPFKEANLPAIQKKMLQLNTELAPSGVALDSAELAQLEALFKFLGAPPKQPVSQPQFLALLLKTFNTWPEASRFPALDLLRLLALYSKDPIEMPDLLKTLLTAARTHETSLMLVARLVVNFCESDEGRETAMNEISTVLEYMEDDAVWQSTNKNLKLAVATVYMSYSTLLLKRHNDDTLAIQYVGAITKILEKERDQQVQYRLLIALGNLIFAHESAKEAAAIFEVRRVVQAAVLSRPTSEKISTSAVANALRQEINEIEMKLAKALGIKEDDDDDDTTPEQATIKNKDDADMPGSSHRPHIDCPSQTPSPSSQSGISVSSAPLASSFAARGSEPSSTPLPSGEAESIRSALMDAGESDLDLEMLLKEQAMMEQRLADLKRRREEEDEAFARSLHEEEMKAFRQPQTAPRAQAPTISSSNSSSSSSLQPSAWSSTQTKLEKSHQERMDEEMARLLAESENHSFDLAQSPTKASQPHSDLTQSTQPVFTIFEKRMRTDPASATSIGSSSARSNFTGLSQPISYLDFGRPTGATPGLNGNANTLLANGATAQPSQAARDAALSILASANSSAKKAAIDLTKPTIDLTKKVYEVSSTDDDDDDNDDDMFVGYGGYGGHGGISFSSSWKHPNFGGYGSFDDDDSDGHQFGEDDDDEEMPGFSEWVLNQARLWDSRMGDYGGYYSASRDTTRNVTQAQTEQELRDLLANIQAAEEEIAPQDRTGTPEGMASNIALLEHQKIGLTWLQKMEEGTNKGGILGDDMGLGKTIQSIALIVSRPAEPIDDPVFWDNNQTYYLPPPVNKLVKTKATLVVAPVALMYQWAEEIRTKTQHGLLKVHIHHGNSKINDPEMLRRYDVIITSNTTFANEMGISGTGKKGSKKPIGTLFKAHFHRVILDEAHIIKNKNTKASLAAAAIASTYRWCLTGTPIQNSVDELYSLIRFLNIRPYCDWDEFRNKISTPMKKTQQYGPAMQRVQALLKAVCLRRTKTCMVDGKPILNLPDRNVEIVHAPFSADEHAFYQALETRTRERFNAYVKAGTVMKNYSNILLLLLRLRQACCHPHLIKDFEKATDEDAPQGQKAHVDTLLDSLLEDIIRRLIANGEGNWECPICMDVSDESVIMSACGHVYCRACITDFLTRQEEEEDRKCPECRRPAKIENYIPVADFNARYNQPKEADPKGKGRAVDGDDEDGINVPLDVVVPEELDDWISSSKIDRMLDVVREALAKREKVIVFSQFTSLLNLIEKPLNQEGIKYLRYDGSMTAIDRNEAVQRMIHDPSCGVMLISLKCGSLGLNLTVANHVVIMDPWWNPALENQAIDRVHRIGQRKNVFVHRLCIPDSVEDRILELQKKKKALADGALGEGAVPRLAKLGMQELMYLFRGGR
ncbi:hypothetical protein BGX33_006640 [Mortierella sp. NVP41]|nr:hypothetical protein BGX33_006640 [Mortierella sp. NVP41]